VTAADAIRPVQWPATIAGAVVAAGVSFALNAFAAGIGLAVASTAPTWRDSSSWLWLVSGLYLLFVALCAFGIGGYIAGRLCAPEAIARTPESEFRDGLRGLVMWGLATILAALMALGLAASAAPALSPSGNSNSTSVAGENIIASELDELFRSNRPIPDISYRRAEAARILLKAGSRTGIGSADRDYLGVITANAAGLDLDRAQDRVARVIGESRTELHRARVAAVLQAFFIGAALFAGAAIAWLGAVEGGHDRENNIYPLWDWSFRRPARPRPPGAAPV